MVCGVVLPTIGCSLLCIEMRMEGQITSDAAPTCVTAGKIFLGRSAVREVTDKRCPLLNSYLKVTRHSL